MAGCIESHLLEYHAQRLFDAAVEERAFDASFCRWLIGNWEAMERIDALSLPDPFVAFFVRENPARADLLRLFWDRMKAPNAQRGVIQFYPMILVWAISDENRIGIDPSTAARNVRDLRPLEKKFAKSPPGKSFDWFPRSPFTLGFDEILDDWLKLIERCESDAAQVLQIETLSALREEIEKELDTRHHPAHDALYRAWLQWTALSTRMYLLRGELAAYRLACAETRRRSTPQARARFFYNLNPYLYDPLIRNPHSHFYFTLTTASLVGILRALRPIAERLEAWPAFGDEYFSMLTNMSNVWVMLDCYTKPQVLELLQTSIEDQAENQPSEDLSLFGRTNGEVRAALECLREPLVDKLRRLAERAPAAARLIFDLLKVRKIDVPAVVAEKIGDLQRQPTGFFDSDDLGALVAALSTLYQVVEMFEMPAEKLMPLENLKSPPWRIANHLFYKLFRKGGVLETIEPEHVSRVWEWVRAGSVELVDRFQDNPPPLERRVMLAFSKEDVADAGRVFAALEQVGDEGRRALDLTRPIGPQAREMIARREREADSAKRTARRNQYVEAIAKLYEPLREVLQPASIALPEDLFESVRFLAKHGDGVLRAAVDESRAIGDAVRRAEFVIRFLESGSWPSFLEAKHGLLRSEENILRLVRECRRKFGAEPGHLSRHALKQLYAALPPVEEEGGDATTHTQK